MLNLFSPAKLNLFFRVLHKRPDQFHEIASFFQAIDLGDLITIDFSDEDRLTCSNPKIPCDERNIAIKALRLFRRKTDRRFPVSIHLEKRIPAGAGLGGGSSNGATVLWALKTLAQETIDDTTLKEWAAEIGSDLSFFFSQGSAYCRGRGEKVENLTLPHLGEENIWVAKPKEELPTPLIYQRTDLSSLKPRDPEYIKTRFLQGFSEYFNDLEPAAFQTLPKLYPLKQRWY